jgi:hypothetical protein
MDQHDEDRKTQALAVGGGHLSHRPCGGTLEFAKVCEPAKG